MNLLRNVLSLFQREELPFQTSSFFSKPRPTWDEYFLELARKAASRATCPRLSCGCVIASPSHDVRITGFNGSLSGEDHCIDVGCDMREGHCVRAAHAEENAVARAAKTGIPLDGCTAYVTNTPCRNCFRILLSAGISRVVYGASYRLDPWVTRTALNKKIDLKSAKELGITYG